MDPVEDIGTHKRLDRVEGRLFHNYYKLAEIRNKLDFANSQLDTISNSVGVSYSTYAFTSTNGVPISLRVNHQVDTGDIVVALPVLLLLAWQMIRSIFNSTRGLAL